jgi:perosamine synthetase
MLTTNDAELARRARELRSFCASVSAYDRHASKAVTFETYEDLGYNYRMTDLQAAIGIAQLHKLPDLLAGRARVARRYNEAFAGIDAIATPCEPPYARHAYQSYGIRLTGASRISRNDLLSELTARGVSCRRGIPPAHLEPLYQKRLGLVSLPVTEDVAANSLFIPIYGSMSEADQARVIDAVISLVSGT